MPQEREQIRSAYLRMYEGMLRKKREVLEDVLADSFVLVHMTGMRQTKEQFIHAVMDGTLNYFTAEHPHINVRQKETKAELCGQSVVLAAVFGGGKHTWHLQQDCTLEKGKDGVWRITEAIASTW